METRIVFQVPRNANLLDKLYVSIFTQSGDIFSFTLTQVIMGSGIPLNRSRVEVPDSREWERVLGSPEWGTLFQSVQKC